MGKRSFIELVRSGHDFRGNMPAGFNERADALFQAADGTDLNAFWDEVNQVIRLRNAARNRVVDLLSYRVTEMAEEVTVPDGTARFEKASEYGQPKGIRTSVTRFWRGFSFDMYDLAIRYTRMFLAVADRRQLQSLTQSALEAENILVHNEVLKTTFNPINGSGFGPNEVPVTVYKFYNADGEVPPAYGGYTHAGTHNHYLRSDDIGGAGGVLTDDVVEGMATHLAHHGYEYNQGYRYVLVVNRQEAAIIRTWRVAAGQAWDFIPSVGYGGGVYLPADQGQLVDRPAGTMPGQIGTYGPWHVIEEAYIPAGYLLGFVTGGPDNISNPVGLREHDNPALRGLRIEPGQRSQYPLIDSFFERGIGSGIRHRGAGVVVQVGATGSYVVPALYA